MPQFEIPPRAVPENDAGYFEKITQAVFQAGFSWQVIRQKWPDFKRAFSGFDIDTVADFSDHDIERLLEDKGIVRNARKIEATIANARTCQALVDDYGSMKDYLRSTADHDYYRRAKDFSKRFKYLGPMGAYFFFYSVGEDVPPYDDWRALQDA